MVYKRTRLDIWISNHGLILSFLFIIVIGAFFLKLPCSTIYYISWTDALFTATSAVCVTGLVVVDTATQFSFFGKIVILCLIQIGGLGIMTFATAIIWTFKQKISVSERVMVEDAFLKTEHSFSLKYFLFFLLKFTFITEFIGACLYFFVLDEINLGQRLFFSIFHSISAFCNAGFSLYTDSLIRYGTNIYINFITIILIILGGIGFLVVFEIRNKIIYLTQKNVQNIKKYRTPFLSLHSWTVITTSIILIILGTGFIYMFQSINPEKITLLEALFQSVSCRTAGFNTIDLTLLSKSSLLIMIFLMFIGGSPGSTAGGIKTTTFATLIFLICFGTSNLGDVTARERTIPKNTIYQALLVFLLSCFFVFIALIFIVNFQQGDNFIGLLFETVSAFGTVGLSLGITSNLGVYSKIIIIITMFVGRLGSLSIFSIFLNRKQINLKYAEENILIG